MAFQVNWDDEGHTVIRLDYPASYEWEEFFTAMERYRELASTVEHGVYVILNMSGLKEPPGGLLVKLPKIAGMRAENESAAIVVGSSGFMEQIGQIFSRIYGKSQFVATLDDAHALIATLKEANPKHEQV